MSKRVLISFGPLFAVVAFAIIPAMAQAQGRWTVNDTALVGTGNVLNGSKAVVLTDAGLAVIITCEVNSKGTITNPAMGNGTDSVTTVGLTSCVGGGTNGTGCTATTTPENLSWSTAVNTAGTVDTITKVTVKVTLAGTCPDAGGTLTYGSNTATLTDTITNDVVPPAGTPNCTVQTLQSALSGSLASNLGTSGTISGNVYVCTATKEEVGVNDVDEVPPPPAPRIEQIDFKNNQPVLIDHQKKEKPDEEAAVSINEVGERNEVEWQLSSTMGDTKNWPVVYVRQTKPRLEARFALEKATEEFIDKKLEAGYRVIVTGIGSLGAVAIALETEVTKAELEAHKGYFATGEFEAKNSTLANKVLYESATITWKWKVKETGKAAFEQEIGKTTHSFYLTNASPLAGSASYLTLLDIETKGIQGGATKQPPAEAEIIKGVWNEFATRAMALRWYEIEPGNLFRGGKELEYYEENDTVGKTLKEVQEAGIAECSIEKVEGLLRRAEGKCGAWALAYSYALASEGISSAVVNVEPESGAGKEKCVVAGKCQLLIKNWEFVGAGKGGGVEFPYDAEEVKDLQGVPGQGPAKNPPAVFGLHYIVEAPNKGKTLYDPSYGAGPYAGAAPLKEFQEASIEGICGPFEAGTFETQCKKVAPGALKVVSSVAQEFK